MKDLTNEIKAYSLRNILEYGKTTPDKILPKLFNHGLDKKDIKNVMPKIAQAIKDLSLLKKEQQEKEFETYKKYLIEKEERSGLPDLEDAKQGKVVTRLAPEPSKYNHIGHGLVFLIQYLYEKNMGENVS